MAEANPPDWEWVLEGHVVEEYDVPDGIKEMMGSRQWGQLPAPSRYVLTELVRSRTELRRITAAVENLATLMSYVVDQTYIPIDEERLAHARTHGTARYRLTPAKKEEQRNA